MSDLFGEWVPEGMIDQIFAVMALCPQHTFQVLTKRHERMRDYMKPYDHRRADSLGANVTALDPDCQPLECFRWPLPNVWLGVSVEDQRRADERIPVLLDTPAAVRWVSAEPLLGLVDLLPWLLNVRGRHGQRVPLPMFDSEEGRSPRRGYLGKAIGLDWIVCGGESGSSARPFHIEWARGIIKQCKATGVRCFIKQLGAHPIIADVKPFNGGFPDGTHFGNRTGLQELNGLEVLLRDRKGADPAEWAEDLRVREYPG